MFSASQRDEIVQARDVYKDGASRPLDWPEQVWDSWLLFEQIYGSESSVEVAQELIEKHRVIVTKKRQKVRSKHVVLGYLPILTSNRRQ
jgi:hypothetical protein